MKSNFDKNIYEFSLFLNIKFIKELKMKVIISQIVGISEYRDQNGDRVSKYDKSCNICSIKTIRVLAKYEQYEKCGTLSMHEALFDHLDTLSIIAPEKILRETVIAFLSNKWQYFLFADC